MKSIAVVCPSCGGGGSVGNVALRGAEQLAHHVGLVHVVSESFPPHHDGLTVREMVRAPSFTWLRRFGHVARERYFCRAAAGRLLGLAVHKGLDAVLCHGHAATALAGLAVKRRFGVPLAMVVHGDIFERPPGMYGSGLTKFYRRVTPVAYRAADLVIVLSPPMREWALRGGARPDAVRIIPNGIDAREIGLPANAAPPLAARSGPLRVLYVGALAKVKGVGTLLEACAAIRREGVAFRLGIAGSGPLAGSLQAQAVEVGIADCTDFYGAVPRLSLGLHYRAADVLCVPSLSDSLPTVVLEALCAGTPVIGAAVGGIPSLVRPGENGELFPPGDAAALANKLKTVAADRERLARLAAGAQPSVQLCYSWATIGVELTQALRALA